MYKNLKARIVNKHDTEIGWILASDFVPLAGEIIIYDAETQETFDAAYANLTDEQKTQLGRTGPINEQRFKIGDGLTTVALLPFLNHSVFITDTEPTNAKMGDFWIDTTETTTLYAAEEASF